MLAFGGPTLKKHFFKSSKQVLPPTMKSSLKRLICLYYGLIGLFMCHFTSTSLVKVNARSRSKPCTRLTTEFQTTQMILCRTSKVAAYLYLTKTHFCLFNKLAFYIISQKVLTIKFFYSKCCSPPTLRLQKNKFYLSLH